MPIALRPRRARLLLAAAYLLVVLIATWQRSIVSREHTTFAIFRQSYAHLVHHQDLYARYPEETGVEPPDRFKYSPTAAVLLAPFSAMTYPVALLVWNLLNAGLLFLAVTRAVRPERVNLALALLLPEVLAALQASSSNALVAALMLLAILAIMRERHGRASLAIGVGAAIKIFPLAVASLVLTTPRRRRFALTLAGVGVALLLLPLLVVSMRDLLAQYTSWRALELSDAADLDFGASFIRAIRSVWPTAFPNWAFQLAGTSVLLLPLAYREQRSTPAFQLRFGCSVLMFAVLFNHQAERQAFVIAALGAVTWLTSRPRSVPLVATLLLGLTGVSIVPYAVLWLALQLETHLEAASALPAHDAAAGTRRWHWQRLPDMAGITLLLIAGIDMITPGHLLFPWNFWDLAR